MSFPVVASATLYAGTPEELKQWRTAAAEREARLAEAEAVVRASSDSLHFEHITLKPVREREERVTSIFVQHVGAASAPDGVAVHFTLCDDVEPEGRDAVGEPPMEVRRALVGGEVQHGQTNADVCARLLAAAVKPAEDDGVRALDVSRLPLYSWIGVIVRHKTSEHSGDEWRTNTAALSVFENSSADAKEAASSVIVPALHNRTLRYANRLAAFASMYTDIMHISDREADVRWLATKPDQRFDPARPETFSQHVCMQSGCNKRGQVLYAIKQEFRDNGEAYCSHRGSSGGHRFFCNEHMHRGDCSREDSSDNYTLVWPR